MQSAVGIDVLPGMGYQPVNSVALALAPCAAWSLKYKNLLFPRRDEFPPLALNSPSYPFPNNIAGRAVMSIAANIRVDLLCTYLSPRHKYVTNFA